MGEGITADMSLDWIPTTGIGLGAGIVGWVLSWRISDAFREGRTDESEKQIGRRLEDADKFAKMSDEGFRRDFRDLRDEVRGALAGVREDYRQGLSEIRNVGLMASKLQASQDVVNNVTARAIEGITDKMERLETVVADHSSSLKLITELVTSRKAGNRCILDTSEPAKD